MYDNENQQTKEYGITIMTRGKKVYVNTRCFVIESVKFNGVMANSYKDRLPKEEKLTPFLTFDSTLLIKLGGFIIFIKHTCNMILNGCNSRI